MRILAALAVVALSLPALAGCGGSTVTIGSQDGGPPGTDAGGGTCSPLPGCSSATSCPAGDGCNTCSCLDGAWACTELACLGDSAVPICPPTLPTGGTPCASEGLTCREGAGCAPSCTCTSGVWRCVVPPCPPPVCPPSPPQSATACGAVGEQCSYPINGVCTEYQCTCWPSGSWGCTEAGCADGGAPDAGPAYGCTATGGTVTTTQCCASSGDFPNQCAVGACSCPPSGSHLVQTCDCGAGRCFDGTACIQG